MLQNTAEWNTQHTSISGYRQLLLWFRACSLQLGKSLLSPSNPTPLLAVDQMSAKEWDQTGSTPATVRPTAVKGYARKIKTARWTEACWLLHEAAAPLTSLSRLSTIKKFFLKYALVTDRHAAFVTSGVYLIQANKGQTHHLNSLLPL